MHNFAARSIVVAACALAGCLGGAAAPGGTGGTALPDIEAEPDMHFELKVKDNGATDDADPDGAASDPDAAGADGDDGLVDTYDGPACTTTAACASTPGMPFCAISLKQCVQCLFDSHCKDTNHCEKNKCIEFNCTPGSTSCDGAFLVTCNADGKSQTTDKCPDSIPTCIEGTCKVCAPGALFCEAPPAGGQSKNLLKCDASGSGSSVAQSCEGTATCQGKKCLTCIPGTKQCDGDVAMACNNDGTGMQLEEDCSKKGLTCLGGLCVNACAGDFKSNTYVGCDFWGVDLDNAIEGTFDAQNKQYAVVVSNTSDTPATVTVSLGKAGAPTYKTKDFAVAGKALQVINLPDPSWKLPNQNQDGTNINDKAFRIKATQPIVAYQFNPLDNFQVFSNDASLLLPVTSLSNQYYIMTRKQLATKYRSYINVVATMPGDTVVTVKPTCKTLAGAGVPSIQAGATGKVTLAQGQVLNLESDDAQVGDLTGSYVEADKTIVVFGGSEASNSPDTGSCVSSAKGGKICASTSNGFPQTCAADAGCQSACCADHLEEQMFPINTLGTTYIGSRLSPRGKELDAWRVLAVEDATTVNIKPFLGVTVPLLKKGQWYEFQTDKDFVMTADKPILVAQYMASSYATVVIEGGTCTSDDQCFNKYGFIGKCMPAGLNNICAPIGDPSLILGVATSQYLTDYIFLVPDKYKLNFINITLPTGALALLDGKAVATGIFTPLMNSGWQVTRMPIPAGAHRLQLTQKGGLVVYGYDKDVSYGYAGGAGLAVGGP